MSLTQYVPGVPTLGMFANSGPPSPGCTLGTRPGVSLHEPLTLELAVSGGMATRLDSERHGLTILKDGDPVLRYTELLVNDAKAFVRPLVIKTTNVFGEEP